MMDGTAVEAIASLQSKLNFVDIGDVKYARGSLEPVIKEPIPAPLEGVTLCGMIRYISEFRRDLPGVGDDMVRVLSPFEVEYIGPVEGFYKKRTVYYRSELDQHLPCFPFGEFLDVESFIIKSRALFVPSGSLDEVVSLVSKVVASESIEMKDDGVSQAVQVKKGVSGSTTLSATTRGIYPLCPWRTFREIEQPESAFILRLKGSSDSPVRAALFDAGGESWRLSVMEKIAIYLDDGIKAAGISDLPVIW